MNTLTVIIVGISLLLIFDFFLIRHLRKKKKDRFKVVVEQAKVTDTSGNIPSEFLYDIQQLARIHNIDALIINGSQVPSKTPELELKGLISSEIKEKIHHSLELSIKSNQ